MTILSEDDKLALSPEEIAAIESEEGEDLDTLQAAEDLEAELKAEAAAKVEKEPSGDRNAEDSRAESAHVFVPLPSVDQAELDRLKTAYDEAKEKYDDGDIDYDELSQAKDAFKEARLKTDIAEEYNKTHRDVLWRTEQNNFFIENKAFKSNEALNAAFVAQVNRLIKTPEAATMTDKQVLQAAKKAVEADLRIKHDAADTTGRNAADETGARPGDFAYLDKLDGPQLEAALDKLTPEQLAMYEDAQ